MIGKAVFTFMSFGSVLTVGVFAVAFVLNGGRVPMGIYDLLAIPVIFMVGGITGVRISLCISIWQRKRPRK